MFFKGEDDALIAAQIERVELDLLKVIVPTGAITGVISVQVYDSKLVKFSKFTIEE